MDIAAFLLGQVLAYEDHRKVQTLFKGLWIMCCPKEAGSPWWYRHRRHFV